MGDNSELNRLLKVMEAGTAPDATTSEDVLAGKGNTANMTEGGRKILEANAGLDRARATGDQAQITLAERHLRGVADKYFPSSDTIAARDIPPSTLKLAERLNIQIDLRIANGKVFDAINYQNNVLPKLGLKGDELQLAEAEAEIRFQRALTAKDAIEARLSPLVNRPGTLLPGLDEQLRTASSQPADRAMDSVRALTRSLPDIEKPAKPAPPSSPQSHIVPSDAVMRNIQAATGDLSNVHPAPKAPAANGAPLDLSIKGPTVPTPDPAPATHRHPAARINGKAFAPLSTGVNAPAPAPVITTPPAVQPPAAITPATAPAAPAFSNNARLNDPIAGAMRDAMNTPASQQPAAAPAAPKGPATSSGIDATRQAAQAAIRGQNQPAPVSDARVAFGENTFSRPAAKELDTATVRAQNELANLGKGTPPVEAPKSGAPAAPAATGTLPNPGMNKTPDVIDPESRNIMEKHAKIARKQLASVDPKTVFNKEPLIDVRGLTNAAIEKAGTAAKAVREGAGQATKAFGEGMKHVPEIAGDALRATPRVVGNALGPLAVTTAAYEIGKARNQLDAGDKKGAAETIGSTAGALAAGFVAARGMAITAGQNIQAAGMSTGIPQLGVGAKVVGIGLIAIAGGISGKEFMGALVGEKPAPLAPLKPLTREQELASVPKPIGWEEMQKPSVLLVAPKPSPLKNIPVPGVDDAKIDVPVRVAKVEPKIPAKGAAVPPQSETTESLGTPATGSPAAAASAPAAKAAAVAPAPKAEVKAEAPKAATSAPVAPAPAAKLPQGKVLHVVQEGETMTDIADARNNPAMAKLRKAVIEALGPKANGRDIVNVLAIALAKESGIHNIDTVHAKDKILDTSPEAVKAIAQKLKDIKVVDAKGHINPGFQPRDVVKLLDQTPSK